MYGWVGISRDLPFGSITTTSTLWPLIVSRLMVVLLLALGCPEPGGFDSLGAAKTLYGFAARIVGIARRVVYMRLGALNRGEDRKLPSPWAEILLADGGAVA